MDSHWRADISFPNKRMDSISQYRAPEEVERADKSSGGSVVVRVSWCRDRIMHDQYRSSADPRNQNGLFGIRN
jgi:hypothetical protein